jgi:hypothetical protein
MISRDIGRPSSNRCADDGSIFRVLGQGQGPMAGILVVVEW